MTTSIHAIRLAASRDALTESSTLEEHIYVGQIVRRHGRYTNMTLLDIRIQSSTNTATQERDMHLCLCCSRITVSVTDKNLMPSYGKHMVKLGDVIQLRGTVLVNPESKWYDFSQIPTDGDRVKLKEARFVAKSDCILIGSFKGKKFVAEPSTRKTDDTFVASAPQTETICKVWINSGGKCALGDKCRYLHPAVEQVKELRQAWVAEVYAVSLRKLKSLTLCVPACFEAFAKGNGRLGRFHGNVTQKTVSQTLLFVAVGAVADTGVWRKSLLVAFAFIAAFYWLAALLFIVMNVFASGAWVFIYAYLPILARSDTDYLKAAQDTPVSTEILHRTLDLVASRISTHSFVWMYSDTLLTLIFINAILALYVPASSLPETYSAQVSILFAGVILMAGVSYAFRFMKERPGPPFPQGSSAITYSLKRVWAAFSNGHQLKNLFLFLLGWFMVSDVFNTLISVVVLLSIQLLGFTTKEILIISIEAPLLAIPGAYLWNRFQVRMQWTTKSVLIFQTSLYTLMCLFVSIGTSSRVAFGYKHRAEVYVYAGLYGFALGALQSTCRSLFASLLPPGHEGSFYSLYLLTDNGSSWIGPLICRSD
ncbi:Autophagy protein 22 [Chytriomyces hyalinus]|nr:Autophagy protein 22 [Chytriomyces hyalinus]